MKLFIFSDIHGSFYYLNSAIEAFKREQADYLIILGDELYHGARNPLPEGYNPKKVTSLLNQYSDKIIAVRGNCDSEVDAMVLNFPMMSDYSMMLFQGRRLFLTHGHIYHEGNLPPLANGDMFFYGHTHLPKAEMSNGIIIVNPGSISMPKENSAHSYGVLEENKITLKDLNGQVFKELSF